MFIIKWEMCELILVVTGKNVSSRDKKKCGIKEFVFVDRLKKNSQNPHLGVYILTSGGILV